MIFFQSVDIPNCFRLYHLIVCHLLDHFISQEAFKDVTSIERKRDFMWMVLLLTYFNWKILVLTCLIAITFESLKCFLYFHNCAREKKLDSSSREGEVRIATVCPCIRYSDIVAPAHWWQHLDMTLTGSLGSRVKPQGFLFIEQGLLLDGSPWKFLIISPFLNCPISIQETDSLLKGLWVSKQL